VRGADHEVSVRRKSRVAGIWVNAKEMPFEGVPRFYWVGSSRPLGEVLSPAAMAFNRIGLDNLVFTSRGRPLRSEDQPFREALIATEQSDGFFAPEIGRVDFLGERLFRTTIAFPANVPTGTYRVEVFLVRQKDVVSGQTTPLIVTKLGVGAAVYDFADRRGLLYGIVAVAAAVMAGWLASLPFRNA
jgi:uncharacterized protein (TIGR02186 family)